jgi:GDP-mannose 6-dehydrogenase
MLIGKGMQLSIYDPEVHLAKLLGANRSFVEKHLPHIGEMLRADIDEVIVESDILVVGLTGVEISDALGRQCRPDQILFDLVHLVALRDCKASVVGLCW